MRQSVLQSGRLQKDHEFYPVHLIGAIQPHGFLLVSKGAGFTIVQASQNTGAHLNVAPETLIGQSLSKLIASSSMTRLQQRLELCSDFPSYVPVTVGTQNFDGQVHQMDDQIILELEPVEAHPTVDPVSLQDDVQQAMARLRHKKDITVFLQAAVAEIQALTGYDRVMAYRFDDSQAGEVVAEVKPTEAISYLGLHYPATDVPELVRQLYQESLVRFIPDLVAPQAALVTAESISSESTLDLRHAMLRGVDPCCIEYHQNMNVTGLGVIALVSDHQLWGLIACHHPTAHNIPYAVRSACKILGQFIGAELTSKVNQQALDELNTLKAIQADFIDSISRAEGFKQALIHPEPRLLDVVRAQGTVVCLDNDLTLIGNTPTIEEVQPLIDWAMSDLDSDIFHTDCLSNHYPESLEFKTVASGALVLKISQLRRYLIVWFRPEVLQTVNWAGNPNASVRTTDDGEVLICPRTSFEAWQEIVQATALPWQAEEIANALALKNAIVGIVLNKADELAQINLDLERSNRELDSFAYAASHDLKEPLRGITNFSNLLMRRNSQGLDESGMKRLRTLVKLSHRMDALIDALLRFSRLGQTELHLDPTDLNAVLSRAIDVLKAGREGRANLPPIQVPHPLPWVNGDPVLLAEVFSNLLSNALKYTDKAQPRIEVGHCMTDDLTSDICVLYVKDDGIGVAPQHLQTIFRLFKRLHERDSYGGGTGAGLTITQKIIERHGGRIWVESTPGEGTIVYFVLNCYKN
ncbi:MAG: ATP-binding protein [Cyanobacteria bacterium P01_D01_bin.156]